MERTADAYCHVRTELAISSTSAGRVPPAIASSLECPGSASPTLLPVSIGQEKLMRKLWLPIGVIVTLLSAACFGGPPPPDSPHRDVVVFGDSNAWGIGCSIGDAGELVGNNPPFPCSPQPDFSVSNQTAGACTIAGGTTLLYNHSAIPPSCNDWASQWPGVLDERTPRLVVLNTGGWEIVDRWVTFPSGPGCSTTDAYNCPAPDYQWGDPNPANLVTAQNRYTSQLLAAINLFVSKGAKVLVLNSPYYAPQEPQVPGLADVWYEAYPATQPANWSPDNANITYRSSKVKTEQFNATLQAAFDQHYANNPNVKLYNLWQHVSPVDPGTQAPAYSDLQCPAPNEKNWPTTCPGQAVQAREPDHGHFSYDGYQNVIMPYVLPQIRQMLS